MTQFKGDQSRWEKKGQPAELVHHKGSRSRRSDSVWMAECEKYFKGFGYNSNYFTDKTIIDLGAGSKSRANWFTKSKIISIEPLADKFKSISHYDLDNVGEVYSEPAEKYLTHLQDTADAIICINVLDHCYNAKIIMENCYKYLKSNGEFCLSVDLHDGRDDKHPIGFTLKSLKQLIEETGFKIIKETDVISKLYSGHCSGVTVILKKK
jgi:SAM-dependent methyltransferase|tara:strand:- start:298 stop:924 length:627 start_codon:yes stop_codon:yes gene_type:complete